MSVLLPAPFSPTSAWISPGASSSETPSLASTGPKRRVMPRKETAGASMVRETSGGGRRRLAGGGGKTDARGSAASRARGYYIPLWGDLVQPRWGPNATPGNRDDGGRNEFQSPDVVVVAVEVV